MSCLVLGSLNTVPLGTRISVCSAFFPSQFFDIPNSPFAARIDGFICAKSFASWLAEIQWIEILEVLVEKLARMVQVHRLVVSEPSSSSPHSLITSSADSSTSRQSNFRQNTAREKELHSNPRERNKEGQGQRSGQTWQIQPLMRLSRDLEIKRLRWY